MSGFVGVVRGAGRGVRRDELAAFAPIAERRGSDGTGVFVDGEIGLLGSRLAIQGGHESDQPLVSADGRFVLVYNGELFASHRRAVRGRLRAEGAGEVRAASDTALLLAWLAHRLQDRRAGAPVPVDALEPLRGGMYAFALADLRAREVLLHADPDGIKPLYAAALPSRGETWFASTRTALWAAMGGARALDPEVLAARLVSPGLRGTLARGVAPIEDLTGRVVLVGAADAGRLVPVATVRGAVPTVADDDGQPPDLDTLREAVADAAREAGQVDGPVSILLSGGLDSAAVAAGSARPDALAITGRFGPPGGPFDESPVAAEVASRLALRHEIVDLSDRDLVGDLDDVVDALEEPIGGPGSLALHRVAHRARAHGRVVLVGTGGDERFAGYVRVALALGRAGPWTEGYDGLRARMEAAGPDPRRRWVAAVDRSDDLLPWLHPAFRASLPLEAARAAEVATWFGPGSGTEDLPPARALAAAEVKTSLRTLLAVDDRVTMALALEARPVLCLLRVPEVAARLPDGWLVGADGEGKRALRAALEGRVPDRVRGHKRKRAASVPFHRAATGAGRDRAAAVLLDRRFAERGWWDVDACRALLSTRRPDHDRALFTVLSLEIWARRFLDGEALAAAGGAP